MSNYTASRLGEKAGGSADPKELFLKVFAGEVLTAFNTNNIAMPLHRVRTISSGSSAQFPLTGIALNHSAHVSYVPASGPQSKFTQEPCPRTSM